VDERIIVGTEDARILIFESNGEMRSDIGFSPASFQRPCHALIPYGKGFIAGGGAGSVIVFEKADDTTSAVAAQTLSLEHGVGSKELYKKSKEFILQDENAKVTNMAVSPSEDNFVCTMENSQIYNLTLGNAEVKVSHLGI
jgi:hypothetical protein